MTSPGVQHGPLLKGGVWIQPLTWPGGVLVKGAPETKVSLYSLSSLTTLRETCHSRTGWLLTPVAGCQEPSITPAPGSGVVETLPNQI